jgi:hypothetical protein
MKADVAMTPIASKRNRGQALVEFALAVVLVGFVGAAGTMLFGPGIRSLFLQVNPGGEINIGGIPVIINPTGQPMWNPTATAMYSPTVPPINTPTMTPIFSPTVVPSNTPTMTPIFSPTPAPTQTRTPTVTPAPTNTPAPSPTRTPTAVPTLTYKQWCLAQGTGYSWNWLTGKCMHNGHVVTPTPQP